MRYRDQGNVDVVEDELLKGGCIGTMEICAEMAKELNAWENSFSV